MSEQSNRQYAYIFISSGVFFLLFAVAVFYLHWDKVYQLDLGDNDNYMRYLQFSHWLKQGNWFLEPMPRFNPDDGQIMHWSRIVDIPLALVTRLASIYTDMRSAESIAMLLVPLLYLFATACCIGYLSDRFFNPEVGAIAIIFTYASPLLSKFIGANIDHHNLQILLLCATLASSALIQTSVRAALVQGLCIALSIWVGLENIFVIALLIALLSLYAVVYRAAHVLRYHATTCLSAGIWGTLFLLLNRPLDEFLTPYYDAISFPFIAGLIVSGLFFIGSAHIVQRDLAHKWAAIVLCATLCFSPILYLYPELRHGALYNYPPLLIQYWLSHVREAISLLEYILRPDIAKSVYILIFLPALAMPIFIRMDIRQWLYYLLAIAAFALPLLWQFRALPQATAVMLPMQAFACYRLREAVSTLLLRAIIILGCAPLVLFFILHSQLKTGGSAQTIYPDIQDSIALLNRHHIHNRLILAPVDYGSKILTFTDNRIISAPYHRNIRGNTISVNIFISDSEEKACQLLRDKRIDYIVLSEGGNSDCILMVITLLHACYPNRLNAVSLLSIHRPTPICIKLYTKRSPCSILFS